MYAEMDIVAIGGIRVDHVITADGTGAGPVLGGNALYAAAAARLWGARVGVVSRLNQQLAMDALRPLVEAGISLAGVVATSGTHGLSSYFRYLPDGQRVGMTAEEFHRCMGTCVRPGADAADEGVRAYTPRYEQLHRAVSPEPADMPDAFCRASSFLLMTMPWHSHHTFTTYLVGRGGALLLDPYPPYMARATDTELAELLRAVTVLLPSEVELRSRFPDLDVLCGARRLLSLGCVGVVVKLGARGSLVLRRHRDAAMVPVYPTDAKDPTGAGDSFLGGFAIGLLETGDMLQAALYGTVAASFAVEDIGLLHVLSTDRGAAERRLSALRHLLR